MPWTMYDTVLVPTDGSDVSLAAAQEAVELTASQGTIHALAVLEELPMYKQSGRGAKLKPKARTEERAALEEATERIAQVVETADRSCVRTVTEGVPYLRILEYAGKHDVDAIVMGKRGPGAAVDEVLGSTSERLIRKAGMTVVVVPES